MNYKVGIVIPTLGNRVGFLLQALESIQNAGGAFVLLVGRKGFDASVYLERGLIHAYLDETSPNLAGKINYGMRALPDGVRYVNWLGDDDLYTPQGLSEALTRIEAEDQPVLVYGGCDYIDKSGSRLFSNKSGQWAIKLLRFGPQLVPQPGALYRRDVFQSIGGLNETLGMAFDFDLFLRFSKIGKCAFVPATLAMFRWHSGSLSVSRRRQSVEEASTVRVMNLPSWLRPFSLFWELPLRVVTYLGGSLVSLRFRNQI